jgi:hypothetical protein
MNSLGLLYCTTPPKNECKAMLLDLGTTLAAAFRHARPVWKESGSGDADDDA